MSVYHLVVMVLTLNSRSESVSLLALNCHSKISKVNSQSAERGAQLHCTLHTLHRETVTLFLHLSRGKIMNGKMHRTSEGTKELRIFTSWHFT